MENQVQALLKQNIRAALLNSSVTQSERKKVQFSSLLYRLILCTQVMLDLQSSKPSTKLLYVTPELIATDTFMSELVSLYNRNLLSACIIDEVSYWVERERERVRTQNYLYTLGPLHQSLGTRLPTQVPQAVSVQTTILQCAYISSHSHCHQEVSGTDARCVETLTYRTIRVQEDIVSALGLHKPAVFITSFNRVSNLSPLHFIAKVRVLGEYHISSATQRATGWCLWGFEALHSGSWRRCQMWHSVLP